MRGAWSAGWFILVAWGAGCGEQVFLDPPDSGLGVPDAHDGGRTDSGGLEDTGVEVAPDVGPNLHRITINRAGCGAAQGRVESQPSGLVCAESCTGEFEDEAEVTLSAVGSTAMPFTGWSGACGGDQSCVLHADQDQAATARFSDLRWARAQGGLRTGSYGHVRSIVTDAFEAAYLGGYWSGGPGFDFGLEPVGCVPQGHRLYLTKLRSADGGPHWVRCMGSADAYATGELTSLTTVEGTDVAAVGYINYQPNQEGDPPGHVDLGGGPISCLREGDQPEPSGRVLFIARYDGLDGSLRWERHDCLTAVASQRVVEAPGALVAFYNYEPPGEAVTVAGSTVGATFMGLSMILVRYSASDGAPAWVRAFGPDDPSRFGRLWVGDLASDGAFLYATGVLQGTANLGGGPQTANSDVQELFLAKYRLSDGGLEWVRTSFAPRPDGMSFVATPRIIVSRTGDLLLLGQVWGTVDLGLGAVAYSPEGTYFLGRYAASDGGAVWIKELACTEPYHLPDLAEEADGDILVGGALCAVGGSTALGLSALRFDAQGNLQTARTLTSTAANLGIEDVAIDSRGRLLFGATLGGTANYCDDFYYTAGYDGVVYGAFSPEE